MTQTRCTLISHVRMAECGSLWGQWRDMLVKPSFINVRVALPLQASLTIYYWSWYRWWNTPHCCFWVSTCWSYGEYWLVSLFISIRRQLTMHANHHWIILHYPALCAGYRCMCDCCKVNPTQRVSLLSQDGANKTFAWWTSPRNSSILYLVTQHVDFTHVCLCRTVLTVSLYAHLHHYESVELPDDENRYAANHAIHLYYVMFTLRKFWYLAYRQLT